MYGTYETIDGKPAVRFERRYPHPVDRVWRAVTEPDQLAHWFPSAVEVDLREGGEMSFTFPGGEMEPMDGAVTVLDPPRRFAFLWGEEELRIELEPDGDGCRLHFTHVSPRASRPRATRRAGTSASTALRTCCPAAPARRRATRPRTSGVRTTRSTSAAGSRPAPRSPGSA